MMSTPARLRTSGSLLLPVVTSLLLTLSCSPQLVYQPGAVVPTASPLPYSATVRLAEIEAYHVEPGATMVADPRIENRVTGIAQPLNKAKKDWERSIARLISRHAKRLPTCRPTVKPILISPCGSISILTRASIPTSIMSMWRASTPRCWKRQASAPFEIYRLRQSHGTRRPRSN